MYHFFYNISLKYAGGISILFCNNVEILVVSGYLMGVHMSVSGFVGLEENCDQDRFMIS